MANTSMPNSDSLLAHMQETLVSLSEKHNVEDIQSKLAMALAQIKILIEVFELDADSIFAEAGKKEKSFKQ